MDLYQNEATHVGSIHLSKPKHWKNGKKAEFLLRLGDLLQQGYTLSAGIEFLKYHQKDEVRDILDNLLEKLRQGEPLHEVLGDIGFPNDVLGYLYFSERHGDLSFALIESGKMMERREEMKVRFRKVIRYPLFLLWLVIMLVIFMTRFLFPQFETLYDSLELDFPWFTEWFLILINWAPVLLAAVCLLLLTGILYYLIRFRHLHPHAQLRKLMRIPYLNSFIPVVVSQYFSVQLSCLLKGGLSIFEALTVFENQSHLAFFQQEASQMKRSLSRGERFDEVLQESPFYVKELSEVVAHGQTDGALAKELYHYSNLLLEMIETRTKRVFTVTQPALFAVIGSVVLMMFMSILLPIFNLMNAM